MKLFRYILSALAGVSLFASCIEEEPVASYNLAIDLDKSIVAVGSEGGSATVEVNSGDITWKATSSADWIAFTPATGSGTTKVTITVGESDEDRTGEVSLQAGKLEKLITVVQTGDPHGLTEDDPLTCAEAVVLCGKLADKATTPKKYYVKGIITAIVEEFGTQYGNATFWMGDAEGEKTFEAYRIYYFDNVKYDDPTKQNISEGDNVVIYGVLMNYGGQAETSQNAAYLVKLDANTAPTISCKEPEKVVGASETEATFTIAPKNLTEGWTVSTDASWIKDYTKSGAKDATEIKVSFDANTETEAREATFTVKSAGAKDITLTLKQGGYSAVGTLDNPYTVAQAIAAIKDGGVAGNVYVKGIISNTTKYNFGPTYNTASFWMSDDGVYNDDLEKDFEAYSVYWLGGTLEQPTAAEAIKANFMVGDEVVIYGALTSYTSSSTGLTTYETASKKAKIYSINWAQTDENGVGNADYPFNIAGAQKFIDDTQAAVKAASEAGSTLAIPDVCVKGKVSAVYSQYSAQYHTAIFWISEDGTFNGTEDKKKTTDYAHDFEAYSVYWLENKEWEEGMGTVKEGDDVILKGQYTIYNGLYETASKKAYLYSLNGVTEATPAEVVPELYLNEFDCQNKQIEIYNATDAEVDMTGWIILKNDGEEGEKDTFSIPAALAKVPAKGYAVFTCKQTDAANGPMFGLSGTKGFKIALKKGDAVVDEVDNLTNIVTIEDGKSWGRETDGADKFVIFDTPTIGESNGTAPFVPDFTTVAELNALAASEAAEHVGTLTDAVVSFVPNSSNAIIKDATGSILLYKSGHGLKQGQTYTGEITVTITIYNDLPELTAISAAFAGDETAVAPEEISLATLAANFAKYASAYIKVANLTVTNVKDKYITVKDGETEYTVYTNPSNATNVVGDVITAVGTATKYKGAEQIKVWKMDDITVTQAGAATLDVSDVTGVPAAGVTDATVNVTIKNGDGWTASVTPDGTVVTAASIADAVVTYSVSENTGEAREGSIEVKLSKSGQDDVVKTIKVSQEAAGASTSGIKFSWTRSGNADNVTAGYEIVTNLKYDGTSGTYPSAKDGYYQDGGTVDTQINGITLQTKDRATALFTQVPTKVEATFSLGAGSAKDPLDHPVYACLVDADGKDIEATVVTVATALTKESKDYKVEFPVAGVATAYGVKVYHAKESSWNVRYYGIAAEIDDTPAGGGDNGSDIPDYDPITGFTW